ncbi:hypothetical protein CAOG_08704 [Capsaspora owczarzaki ATCC 30864]|uniref:hypothetical protein n=1 Tax=Capsaspora owczarzaki (strain ATCC 30864) TaxID=595528 RepID=UPI0003522626|nr:hypothetical protein CAOG_08704 [Capsaspora owczarzaki ATCC 30864]|eukprot:XP_011270324.1 hypothetical protein CAOG_08704 [Capsaspora owczarzaki ATCC 30864]
MSDDDSDGHEDSDSHDDSDSSDDSDGYDSDSSVGNVVITDDGRDYGTAVHFDDRESDDDTLDELNYRRHPMYREYAPVLNAYRPFGYVGILHKRNPATDPLWNSIREAGFDPEEWVISMLKCQRPVPTQLKQGPAAAAAAPEAASSQSEKAPTPWALAVAEAAKAGVLPGASCSISEATTARASSSSGSSTGVETADSNRAPLSFWWDIFDGSEDFPLDDFIQNHPVNREPDFNPLDASPEFNWAVGRRLLPSFVAPKSAERVRFSHRGVAIATKSRFVRRCLRRAERNASSIFMVDEATATSCSINQSNIDRLTFHGDLLRDPTLQMDLVATGVPLKAKLRWDSRKYFASFASGTGNAQTGWVMHSRRYTRFLNDIESPLATGSIVELFDALEAIRVGRYSHGDYDKLEKALESRAVDWENFWNPSAVWIMMFRYWIFVERVQPLAWVVEHSAKTNIDMLRYCLRNHYEDMHGDREGLLAYWLIYHVNRRKPNAWNCVTLVLEWLYPERKPVSYDCVHPPRPAGPTVYDKFGVTEEAEEVVCGVPFGYYADWFKEAAGWDMAPVLEWLPELGQQNFIDRPTLYFSNWLYQFELAGFRTLPAFGSSWSGDAHPFALAASRRLVVGCLLAWGHSPSKCLDFVSSASSHLFWPTVKHPYDRALEKEWARLSDRVDATNQKTLKQILQMAEQAQPLRLSSLCRLKLWRHEGSEAAVAKALGVSNIDALLGLVPPVPQPDLRVPEDVAQFVLDMPLARHLQRVPAYHDKI